MTNSTLPRTRQLVITECVCVQLCPTLHDPVDCSPPVSFIRGIFQARYWSGLSFPPPGDRPHSGIETVSPESSALAGQILYL